MRKVTASAVILTALTSCGHNSGISSTQWSFKVPAEDEANSLAISPDSSNTTDGAFVSAVGNQAFIGQEAVKERGSLSNGNMMGPAFNQPSKNIETTAVGLSAVGLSAGLGPERSVPRLSGAKNGGSAPAFNWLKGYQPVAARPDPVAEIKAFLSANSSPNSLSNREPYRSDILTPSLPTVYLPDSASITSTSGNPTDMGLQVASINNARSNARGNASFTSEGLPIIESSVRDVPADYSTESTVAPTPLNDGLPVLEASSIKEMPIGTAILQDLQRTKTGQAISSLSEKNSNGRIDIEILPAEASIANDASVVSASVVSAGIVSAGIVSDRANSFSTRNPTLESLRRSMVVREVSPLVANPSQTADTDASLAREPDLNSLAVEAIAVSSPSSDSSTLESLLETAAQPDLPVDLPVDLSSSNTASPLLEGLGNTQPLPTLYLPIPEATSENGDAAALSTPVSLVRNSLASLTSSQKTLNQKTLNQKTLNQRSRANLIRIDNKLSTQRRQLVSY